MCKLSSKLKGKTEIKNVIILILMYYSPSIFRFEIEYLHYYTNYFINNTVT